MRKINKKNSPAEAVLETPERLGLFLKEIRREAGFTQAEAAGLCNVGVRFLIELEYGKATVALGKVMQVLKGYGIQLYALRRQPQRIL